MARDNHQEIQISLVKLVECVLSIDVDDADGHFIQADQRYTHHRANQQINRFTGIETGVIRCITRQDPRFFFQHFPQNRPTELYGFVLIGSTMLCRAGDHLAQRFIHDQDTASVCKRENLKECLQDLWQDQVEFHSTRQGSADFQDGFQLGFGIDVQLAESRRMTCLGIRSLIVVVHFNF